MTEKEIEVGDYVRTKNGIIDRIKTVNRYGTVTKYDDKEDKISIAINYYINSGLEVNEDDIVKHSKNIIDLIEVGDYVNGILTEDIEEIDNKKVFYSNGEMIAWTNRDKGIETILTKEQYIQNCYKIDTN